jgi:hypothetical protein
MNDCSASRASASVSVTRKSIEAIWSENSKLPRDALPEKWPATRLRIDIALPTYSTSPSLSRNR